MRNFFSLLLFLLLLIFALSGCQKMEFQDETTKQLLGSWEYVSNSGGFSGTGGSTLYKQQSWIHFSEKGYFTEFESSNQIRKERFSFPIESSINGFYKLKIHSYHLVDFRFKIVGDDLYLNEDVYDGFSYHFKRK